MIRYLIFCLIVISLLALGSTAEAAQPAFRYIKYENGTILTSFAIQDSLPQELITYLNKGVPISFDYEVELWKVRQGWFDKLLDKTAISFQVRYDPWEKQYSVLQTLRDLTIENTLKGERETIDLVNSSGRISFAISDTAGLYYIVGRLAIKTMSFSNFKEVESWLKGGISGAKKPDLQEAPDKFGEFVFDLALKISGLKNISDEVKSQEFMISQLPLIIPPK
jgi:hypothetical protein